MRWQSSDPMHAILLNLAVASLVLFLSGCGDGGDPSPSPASEVTTTTTTLSGDDPVPNALVQEAREGNVVAIIGAGVSSSAGLPTFWSFLDSVARDGGREDLVDKKWDSADDFQFALAEALGRPKMCEYMKKELAAPNPLPEAYLLNMGAIGTVPFCAVTSFNWDALLHDRYHAAPWPSTNFGTICGDGSQKRPPLFEVQGSVLDCDSLVISESDYENIKTNRTAFFQSLLSSSVALYVGMNIHGYPLMKDTGPYPKMHYAIVNDISEDTRTALKKKGIEAIVYYNASATNFVGMTNILQELARQVQSVYV